MIIDFFIIPTLQSFRCENIIAQNFRGVNYFAKFSWYHVNMKIFGDRLKELRKEKGLSTSALGKIIDVSDTAICNWENNKHDVRGEQLIKLAQFFGVSTDYLLGLED